MQPDRRILILKVILKCMLLFAVLWLLWVMLSSIPGGSRPRLQSSPAVIFTAPPFVAILPPCLHSALAEVSHRLNPS